MQCGSCALRARIEAVLAVLPECHCLNRHRLRWRTQHLLVRRSGWVSEHYAGCEDCQRSCYASDVQDFQGLMRQRHLFCVG